MRMTSLLVLVLALAPALQASAQPRPTPTSTPVSSFAPLTSPSPSFGPATLVDDVLAESREYDNKPVSTTGVARNVRTDDTTRGPVLQYDLCGRHCIHILDATDPAVHEGATTTVNGIFRAHYSYGRFSADNIIIIAPGGLPRDDSSDWRRHIEGGPPRT